ncbi:hypothetical protein [Actinacidiphila acididurans]|uniref:hypothetical protein n=1 Tax=Actinacidiphila acididurans TaxID=2784346 RepID=UPI001F1B212C|nr:hypothetical protein [Actinacidiphila acididurans]
MSESVLMSGPKVAAIPVVECGESLVDVRRDGSLLVDGRENDPAGAVAHLREGVLERLLRAREALPRGLRLLFVEGDRPPALQREHSEKYADRLRADPPEWSAEQVHSAASRYVPPPRIAPHSAGAAVDRHVRDHPPVTAVHTQGRLSGTPMAGVQADLCTAGLGRWWPPQPLNPARQRG